MKQQGSPFGKQELSQPPLDAAAARAAAGLCPAGWGSAGPVLGEKLSLGRAGQAVLCSAAPETTDFMVRCLGACIYMCS